MRHNHGGASQPWPQHLPLGSSAKNLPVAGHCIVASAPMPVLGLVSCSYGDEPKEYQLRLNIYIYACMFVCLSEMLPAPSKQSRHALFPQGPRLVAKMAVGFQKMNGAAPRISKVEHALISHIPPLIHACSFPVNLPFLGSFLAQILCL